MLNDYKRDTVFCVEATSYEQLALWSNHSNESEHALYRKTYDWEQLNPGSLTTIGQYTRRPVCVNINYVRINGQVVMFYEPTSELVDWRMVRKWLDKEYAHVPKWDGSRRPHCDAMNFGHCLAAIDQRNFDRRKGTTCGAK